MTADVVLQTVLTVGVVVITTLNVALWAFRPNFYRPGPRASRWMGIFTIAWVIFSPLVGAVALGLGGDAVAAGQTGGWQAIVTGVVALACWPSSSCR